MELADLLRELDSRRISKDTMALARGNGPEVYKLLREQLGAPRPTAVQTARILYLLEYIASDSCLDRQPDVLDVSASYIENEDIRVRTQAALNLAKISILWEGISVDREHWMTRVMGGLAGKAELEVVKPLVRRAVSLGIEQKHQSYFDWFLSR